MHIIGFSHHYTKLHGQTYGTLLSVRSMLDESSRPDIDGIQYDTEYISYECVPHRDYRPLKFGDTEMLQLVFIGNKQIPFTTYRELPKDYVPRFPDRGTFDGGLPYSDLVGESFAFKFRGEELPANLKEMVSAEGKIANTVKIFR